MTIQYGSQGVHDGVDTSKVAAIDASGITPGQTRILTVPDSSGVIALTNQLGLRNRLINGGFLFNQRAATVALNDAYAHDRWYSLNTCASGCQISTLSAVENTYNMARLTQPDATAKYMGYAQIIERNNCFDLRGGYVALKTRLRMSASGNVRYAVLSWTGTADAVISDVVNNWSSTSYTPGGFFLASNLVVENCGNIALTANALTDLAINTVISNTSNNVIAFFWTESAVAQNVTLDIGKVQLEPGAVATPFEFRPYGLELSLCQRYYYRTGTGLVGFCGGLSGDGTNNYFSGYISPQVPLRVAPSSIDTSGTAAHYGLSMGINQLTCSALPTLLSTTGNSIIGVRFYVANGAATNACAVAYGLNASAFLGFPAEL